MKEERRRGSDLDYNKLELSIIIPVYNMEKYLVRCLDSVVIALQGMENRVEVLIINDGSQDSSADIISSYCANYDFMQQFDKDNGGLSDVKNFGLARARGEFVIFLDSDDYVEPDMYKVMLQKAREEKADIVVCDLELVYDDPKLNDTRSCTITARNGIFAQIIDMTMMPASWNKLAKRDLYEGLTFPIGKNNEDIAVTPIVLARAKKITAINIPFYKYFQRVGSIQNSTFSENRFVILETSKLCIDRLKKESISEEKRTLIKGSIYLHQVLSLALYPIRREKITNRYRMLKKYMLQVEALFPDIWDNYEIKEFVHWDTFMVQITRQISIFMLKRKWYLGVSIFWSACNVGYDLITALYTMIKNARNHN